MNTGQLTHETTHCGMLLWEDCIISAVLAVAVIVGFAAVCSGAAYTTREISGK